MSLTGPLADALLRAAAGRWPQHLRSEQVREWTAEMHAIRRGSPGSAPARSVRALWFALSLAASPPVGDDGVPRGWQELVPMAGTALIPGVTLVGSGVLIGAFTPMAALSRAGAYLGLTDGEGAAATAARGGLSILDILLPAVLFGLLGGLLGRRFPLMVAPRSRATRAISVALAPLLVAAGLLLGDLLDGRGLPFGPAGPLVYLLWILALGPVIGYAVRLTRTGRPDLALAFGAIGGLAAFELMALPLGALYSAAPARSAVSWPEAMLWFPLSLTADPGRVFPGPHGTGGAGLIALGIAGLIATTLAATGFALRYAMTSSRIDVRVTVSVPGHRPLISPLRQRTGLAVAGTALAVWAGVLAAGDRLDGGPTSRLWSWELRQAAILLAALGLAFAMAGRTRPFAPAVLVGGGLAGVDALLDAADTSGIAVAVQALGIGTAALMVLWRLPKLLDRPAPGPVSTRRTLVWIAVIAAYCAPVPFVQAHLSGRSPDAAGLIRWLTPVSAVLAALLAVIAVAGALAARERRAPARFAVPALIAAPVAMALLGAVVHGGPARLGPAALAGAPFAVAVLAMALWRRGGGLRTAARWWGAGLGAVVLAGPLVYTGVLLSLPLSPLLTTVAGFDADGIPLFHGMLAQSAVFAVLAAFRGVPRGTRRRLPRPVARPGTFRPQRAT